MKGAEAVAAGEDMAAVTVVEGGMVAEAVAAAEVVAATVGIDRQAPISVCTMKCGVPGQKKTRRGRSVAARIEEAAKVQIPALPLTNS